LIEEGNTEYFLNCDKFDQQLKDYDEIYRIEDFFLENKIKFIKYNNTINGGQVRCYNGYLSLS
jgi:hypothetical protein